MNDFQVAQASLEVLTADGTIFYKIAATEQLLDDTLRIALKEDDWLEIGAYSAAIVQARQLTRGMYVACGNRRIAGKIQYVGLFREPTLAW